MDTKKNLGKKMIEKYREINRFRYSIFRITNPAIPTEVRENQILAEIVSDKLKDLKKEVEKDIDNMTIDLVDIEDIFGNRTLEVSKLLADEIILFELETIRKQYINYLKAQKLEEIFPLDDRRKKAEELRREINNLNLTIESLEEIEPKLIASQKEKSARLQGELMALEETFDFVSLEEIRGKVFVRLHGYLGNILSDINSKINFIERNLA